MMVNYKDEWKKKNELPNVETNWRENGYNLVDMAARWRLIDTDWSATLILIIH